jgi:hypothetical protein
MADDMEDFDEEYIDEMEFSKEVLELFKKERAALKKAGLDVDFMIAEIERLIQEADDAKARVEDLKRQMLMSMSKSLVGQKGAPPASVEQLDMAGKDLRKDGDVEEYFKRLWRRTRKPGKPEEDTINS